MVAQFFAEHDLTQQTHDLRYGRCYQAGDIELICSDVFGIDADILADRAALITHPPSLCGRYVRELHALLPAGCRGLLITLGYPQHEKQRPLFAVPEAEVSELYGCDWCVETLERRDILARQPGFVAEGVSAL